jgi:hypothetical protein
MDLCKTMREQGFFRLIRMLIADRKGEIYIRIPKAGDLPQETCLRKLAPGIFLRELVPGNVPQENNQPIRAVKPL